MVERLVQLLGFDREGEPSMITTRQMIALGTRFAALTLFATRQLLESSVQFFDLPAHVVRVLSDVGGQGLIWAIGDDPVNVAVWGNYRPSEKE